MKLLEIEPGSYIVPDLVTDVNGGRNHDGWAWVVAITMIGGGVVRVSGGGSEGNASEAKRLGEKKAREIAVLIDAHRSAEGVEIVRP